MTACVGDNTCPKKCLFPGCSGRKNSNLDAAPCIDWIDRDTGNDQCFWIGVSAAWSTGYRNGYRAGLGSVNDGGCRHGKGCGGFPIAHGKEAAGGLSGFPAAAVFPGAEVRD
ncbi:MAG: hypothetical protein LBE10_12025 [Treponema sp.]|nr:hypothetical protein [Treponema sp.]